MNFFGGWARILPVLLGRRWENTSSRDLRNTYGKGYLSAPDGSGLALWALWRCRVRGYCSPEHYVMRVAGAPWLAAPSPLRWLTSFRSQTSAQHSNSAQPAKIHATLKMPVTVISK